MEETPEEMIKRIKEYLLDEKGCVIDNVPVFYLTHYATETPDVWIDSDGVIYINANVRDDFAKLYAFHETLEYDWLVEQGLPAPRYNTVPETRESEIARQIHLQVHYLELKEAKRMGILEEFVANRP